MEFDPAIASLGAVVVLLVAILIGAAISARGHRGTQVSEEWVQELDKLHSRLDAIAPEITLLEAQIGHLEEFASLHAEATRLRQENGRLQRERKALLDELTRIAELLGRSPGDAGPG
jgi:FtsZ-binding cell division protein ZapB